jgi:CRP-like cAMP-binding protein
LENMQIVELIKQSDVFFDVIDDEILPLAKEASILKFKKKQVIIREGELPFAFYFIQEGKVKIYVVSLSGKEIILDTRNKGETFIEGPSFDGKPCTRTVEALEDTIIITVGIAEFKKFLIRNPIVTLRILLSATEKTRNSYAKILDLTTASASERLIKVLLELSNKYGDVLPFSHLEIADMSGIAVETSSRIMVRLKKIGLISCGKKRITILNRVGLINCGSLGLI